MQIDMLSMQQLLEKNFGEPAQQKDATEAIIDYGFKKLNLNKIYLNVLATNERAIKFYQKLGFGFEGTFKKHLFVDGEYVDLNWYCIFHSR